MTSKMACVVVAAASTIAGPALGADFFSQDVPPALRTETFSVEAFGGYVIGSSTEYVYNPSNGSKLSQLKWDISNAAAVGGRVAIRPLDWLTVRVRGWTTVEADAKVRDYDWFAGFRGFNSYTDVSIHPDTITPSAWTGDASLAVSYWQDDNLSLTVLGGFRHYEAKFEARGGSYIYSTNAFRDTVGSFPVGQPVGTYKQTFDAPYLGLGAAWALGPWTATGELVVSPYVDASANDNHILRTLNIRSRLASTTMVGVAGSLEYRMTDMLSLVGRFEYQRFSEARGSARYTDVSTGEVFYNPKPGSGADAETALLSIGIKARL